MKIRYLLLGDKYVERKFNWIDHIALSWERTSGAVIHRDLTTPQLQ